MTDASDIEILWRAARRLGRRAAVASALPPLWFFTDPERSPEPERIAERLPSGAGLVYRPFASRDAIARGRRLAAIAAERGLLLLAGQDPELAEAIGADGVHLPERRLEDASALQAERRRWVLTGAAHSRRALTQAMRLNLHAAFVSPVFVSNSPSAGRPLGIHRVARWTRNTPLPVYALGGVNQATVVRLRRTGVAGVAAVGALVG